MKWLRRWLRNAGRAAELVVADRTPYFSPQHVGDDRCEITIRFYRAEAELWRKGGAASFFVMLAGTAARELDDTGAFGPYEFFCQEGEGDGCMVPFVFCGREL